MSVEVTVNENFSLTDLGVKLHINVPLPSTIDMIAFDLETDEKDALVGYAMAVSPTEVYYYTNAEELFNVFERLDGGITVIGHHFKGDLHILRKNRLGIPLAAVMADTMLMSYAINPNEESHGLKQLARTHLGFIYPSYRDIVGKGHKKITLDKQPVEVVANYCGADAIATYRLYQHFLKVMTLSQKVQHDQVELPLMKLLYHMEVAGVHVDVNRLKELDVEFDRLESRFLEMFYLRIGRVVNPNSPKQLLTAFNAKGYGFEDTDKRRTLLQNVDKPDVAALLSYREVKKLNSTYVKGLLSNPDLPWVHTTFNQVAVSEQEGTFKPIRTGRLSSSDPNLQNMPTRSEKGTKLREVFTAPEGHVMAVFDYSQIELRLLAHFTGEPVLMKAYQTDKDVHEETAVIFNTTRYAAKQLNFGIIYGAGDEKVAALAGLPLEEASRLRAEYLQKLSYVNFWIETVKHRARQDGYITTIGGRTITIPDLHSSRRYERYHAERCAVNYTIQGSAADIIKVAMLRLDGAGHFPRLQVHDELFFYFPVGKAPVDEVKQTMESPYRDVLRVPLVVDAGVGANWKEAKS